eukprot:7031805-Prymnesium_polylepis.1
MSASAARCTHALSRSSAFAKPVGLLGGFHAARAFAPASSAAFASGEKRCHGSSAEGCCSAVAAASGGLICHCSGSARLCTARAN